MEAGALFFIGAMICIVGLHIGDRLNAIIKILDLHCSVTETGLDSVQHNLRH